MHCTFYLQIKYLSQYSIDSGTELNKHSWSLKHIVRLHICTIASDRDQLSLRYYRFGAMEDREHVVRRAAGYTSDFIALPVERT